MAGTYTKLHIQIIFHTKNNTHSISPEWKYELNQYISGIIREKGHKPIIVNGTTNHIHIFIGLNASTSVSDITRDIKNNSTNFINRKFAPKPKFFWQEGYGAFSYGEWDIERVYNYIFNQEEHHKKISFEEEYIGFMEEFNVDYDLKYLF